MPHNLIPPIFDQKNPEGDRKYLYFDIFLNGIFWKNIDWLVNIISIRNWLTVGVWVTRTGSRALSDAILKSRGQNFFPDRGQPNPMWLSSGLEIIRQNWTGKEYKNQSNLPRKSKYFPTVINEIISYPEKLSKINNSRVKPTSLKQPHISSFISSILSWCQQLLAVLRKWILFKLYYTV